MIIKITKTVSRGKLHVEIETEIKHFYSHDNKILTNEEVAKIAGQDHKIQEMVSNPDHKVGNYRSNETKQKGTWVFKLVPDKTRQKRKTTPKPLTKTSLRSKINKIAKELNEEDESTR